VVECQEERSQFKNRDKAMKMLRAKLYDIKVREQTEEIAGARRAQVGTGDRSERIRTYNYPQSRVTDHRIGFTLYKLDKLLDGDMTELLDALVQAELAEKMKKDT
jgi:peptide chain release factor 1